MGIHGYLRLHNEFEASLGYMRLYLKIKKEGRGGEGERVVWSMAVQHCLAFVWEPENIKCWLAAFMPAASPAPSHSFSVVENYS